MQQLLGTQLAQSYMSSYQQRALALKAKGIQPSLDVICVGNDPASLTYIAAKERACHTAHICSIVHRLSHEITEQDLLDYIIQLNHNASVQAILCQLPLPKHINPDIIIQTITPQKDVDGFHPINLGRLALGDTQGFIPCTPKGIIALLEHYHIDTRGKHIVVLGRSRIVGLPIAMLLAQKGRDATVTMCHSHTTHLVQHCQSADIVITAIGQPHFVQAHWLSPHATVIDVGINRIPDSHTTRGYRIVGDCHPDVAQQVQAMTPVPGGVGPLTVAMLLDNCLQAWENL
jgi:methylenetetrahydrofolate dehydrogenase (NADP+)/methenyltetrahydrofolate cyclohydrolase